MYFIHRGAVDVISEHDGEVFATLRAGTGFGEVALLFSCPRTATIRAKLNTDVFVLTKKDLDVALENYPDVKEQMMTLAKERRHQARVRSADRSKIHAQLSKHAEAMRKASEEDLDDDDDEDDLEVMRMVDYVEIDKEDDEAECKVDEEEEGKKDEKEGSKDEGQTEAGQTRDEDSKEVTDKSPVSGTSGSCGVPPSKSSSSDRMADASSSDTDKDKDKKKPTVKFTALTGDSIDSLGKVEKWISNYIGLNIYVLNR